MAEPDAVMARVGEGIALGQAGDKDAARRVFADLWTQVGDDGDPLHRCAIAHWMADLQDDPSDALAWDLLALAAADALSPGRAQEGGMSTPVSAMYPSLHLNIAEAYRRLGDRERAREHLAKGLAAAGELPEDGYGHMIRGGLDQLARRLAE